MHGAFCAKAERLITDTMECVYVCVCVCVCVCQIASRHESSTVVYETLRLNLSSPATAASSSSSSSSATSVARVPACDNHSTALSAASTPRDRARQSTCTSLLGGVAWRSG